MTAKTLTNCVRMFTDFVGTKSMEVTILNIPNNNLIIICRDYSTGEGEIKGRRNSTEE